MRYLKRRRKRPSHGARRCLFNYERSPRSAHLVLLSTSSSIRKHVRVSPLSTLHSQVIRVRSLEVDTTFCGNVNFHVEETLHKRGSYAE